MHITHEQLTAMLSYDQQTGEFTWLVDRGTRLRAGARAGGTNAEGYRQIGIDRRYYFAHRLAWFYVHGELPAGCIDHINGCRTDNRIANLRVVTVRENNFNIRAVRSQTGHIGVYQKSPGSFAATIKADGRRQYLGSFPTAEAASRAYQAEKTKRHQIGN